MINFCHYMNNYIQCKVVGTDQLRDKSYQMLIWEKIKESTANNISTYERLNVSQ